MGVGAGAGLAITDAAVIGGADAAIDAASVAALSSAAADVGAGVAAGAITGDVAAGLTADQFAAGLTADQIAGAAPIAGAADAASAAATLGGDAAAAAAPAAAAPAAADVTAAAPAAAAPTVAPATVAAPAAIAPPTTATGAVVPGAGALTGEAPAAAATGVAPAAASSTAPAAISNLGAAASPDLTSAQFAAGLSPEQISGADLANTATTLGGMGPSNLASAVASPGLQATMQPTPSAPTPPAPPPSSFGDKVLGKLGDAATSPGAIVGALGLGYQALNQPTVPKATQAPAVASAQLDLAKQATAGAAALEAPLTTGVLPPGAQAAIDNATKAAKARVIGNYASRGMDVGKDAAGNYTNASLAQDLNAIDQQAAGQVFQYADQLYQQGLSQAQISESLYNAILQNTTAQNDTMSKAINNFVTAAAGGRPALASGTTQMQPTG